MIFKKGLITELLFPEVDFVECQVKIVADPAFGEMMDIKNSAKH